MRRRKPFIGEHGVVEQDGRFVWYELLTSNVAAAKQFYAHVVGWDCEDASTPDLPYTFFTFEKSPVSGLMSLPEEGLRMGARPRWVGYVAVRDVDASAQRITQLGGTLYVPPTATNIGRISVVADPQTATLALVTGVKVVRGRQPDLDQPGHVGWHELFAADHKTAFGFYSEVFGWQQAEAGLGSMDSYELFAVDGQAMGGIFPKLPRAPVPFWLYYFNVADIDASVARVKGGGGKIVQGPMDLPDDTSIVRCIDPQGAMFALQAKRTQVALSPRSASEFGWAAEWEGISSRGRLVKRRD